MIGAVPSGQIATYASLFGGPRPAMVLASVGEGNALAQLWLASDDADRRTSLLWDQGNNVLYLAGDVPCDASLGELSDLVASCIGPMAIRSGRPYFRARALEPVPDGSLTRLFRTFPLERVTKRLYRYVGYSRPGVAAPTVEPASFVPIDRALLAREGLGNLPAVRQEIRFMWPSEERFCARGFGYAALSGDVVVCWCTAEYVSQWMCGIGIETVEDLQRRGVATATAAHFVADSLARGIQPHWECDTRNIPSIRVAEKVGFTPVEEREFWTGDFRS